MHLAPITSETERRIIETHDRALALVCAHGRNFSPYLCGDVLHVVDLLHMLVAMGAQIDGIGSNLLVINGWKQQTGRPIDPASVNIQSAFTDCKGYALNLTRDIQTLLLQQQK